MRSIGIEAARDAESFRLKRLGSVISGDKNVRYASRSGPWQAVAIRIPGTEMACESGCPRRNNIMFAVRRAVHAVARIEAC